MLGKELLYIIRAQDDATKTFQKVRGDVEDLDLSAGKAGKTLDLAFSQLNRETGRQVRDFGLSLVGAVTDFAEAGRESIQVGKALDSVLRSTNGAAGLTKTELEGLATSLANVTNFEDETVQRGENMLLTFTKIGKDVFPQATEAMLNISTAMGTDVQSSAIQLGKALNDPIGGIDALTRVGVQFTDQQKEMVKQMVKAGDVAGAQKVILGELNTEFGGLARATVDAQTQLNKSWNDIKEAIGKTLIPALDSIAQKVTPILQQIQQWITDNPELAKTIGLVVLVIGGLLTVFGTLVVVLGTVAASLAVLGITLAVGGALAVAIIGIGALIAVLIQQWEALQTYAVMAVTAMTDAVNNFAVTVGEKMGIAEESVKRLLKTLKEAASQVASVATFGLSSVVGNVVGRATGGRVDEPFTLVGERGPELVSLPSGSYVYDAGRTQDMLGSPSVTSTVSVGPFYITKEVDADSVIDKIIRAIQLQKLQAA
jgi:phage-related minor tail protein